MASTLVTLLLVTGFAAAYGYARWAGYYIAAGVWSLVFLGLTPLVIKAMMFDRRPLLGLALLVAKFFWLGAMFALFMHWSRGGASARVLGSALIAGVTTPLLVVVLRALGSLNRPPEDNLKSMREGKR